MRLTGESGAESLQVLIRHLEYRSLVGRRDELGLCLRPDEILRLRDLEAGLDSPPPCGSGAAPPFLTRARERRSVFVPLEFRAGGVDREGVARNVSTGGIFVSTSHPLRSGERPSLRLFDDGNEREWRFSAEVVWTRHGPDGGMGLRLLGVPFEMRLGGHRRHRPLRVAA